MTSANFVDMSWKWLCRQRRDYPANADIWHLRFHWHQRLPDILGTVRAGHWRFSAKQRVVKSTGEEVVLWGAEDAFVLKLLALCLQEVLPVHRACTHVRGHGGHKFAVRQADHWVNGGAYTYVCKTDIRGYYAHIDKHHLLGLLRPQVADPIVFDLLHQAIHYSVEWGGNFHTPRLGISRGCPLSPLLAGFHLYELDRQLARRKGVRYLRFMDDLLILTRSHSQLRRAVASMNRWFAQAGLVQHPDKTFIGRIERGFDWLGYHLASRGVVAVATSALANMLEQVCRLYEQTRASPEQAMQRVANYQRHWRRWVMSGLRMSDPPVDGSGVIAMDR